MLDNKNIENIINNNDLTIDIDTEKKEKIKKSSKNISKNNSKKKIINSKTESENTHRNNNLQSTDNLSLNFPSIINNSEFEKSEISNINEKQSRFYSGRNASDENKKDIKATIINENVKNGIESTKKIRTYKIIFIYKNQDFYITIKQNSKISDIKEIISKEINLDKDKIILIYNDKEIDDLKRNVPVNTIINFAKLKSRPIIHVKKKYVNNLNSLNYSNVYKFNIMNYENKIKIINYPTMSNSNLTADEDLFNVVSEFCKNNSITSAFQIEKNDDNPDSVYHLIYFSSSDIVFDFNRYFTSLKISNPIFKDTKVVMLLSKRKINNNINNTNEDNRLRKRSYKDVYEEIRKNGENKRNLLNMNINRFINNTGPYITPYDQYKSDEKENKKKWLNPKGFISSVNKYSGIKYYS
jgi:hypothetical protein